MGLELNMDTKKHMVIGRKGRDIELENSTIKCSSQNDYLGVMIGENGKGGKDKYNEKG